jgi:uncharacterized protein YdeI (YjbR/CyaY-like superfamily)
MIEVPEGIVASFRQGKRPKVSVTIGTYTFRSTMAVYGGRYFLPLNRANRAGAGVELGQTVEVELALDAAPRFVELPTDLARALDADPALREAFDRLAYSTRRDLATSVSEARREETRARRIARITESLQHRGGVATQTEG